MLSTWIHVNILSQYLGISPPEPYSVYVFLGGWNANGFIHFREK